jgi:GNAT superfamily N-acetyltransferase
MRARLATESDARQLAELWIRTLRDAYGGVMPLDFVHESDVDARAEKIRGWIASERHVWMVGALAETLVGYGALAGVPDAAPEEGEIVVFGTLKEHRRCGYGRVVMHALEDEARRRGWTHLVLWVVRENVGARTFYERQGFVFDGTSRVDLRLGFPATLVRYRKTR